MRPEEFTGMSMYGCCAIDSSWPLKLQKTLLSGKRPFVRLRIANSMTFWAAGIVLVSPQKECGGAPERFTGTVAGPVTPAEALVPPVLTCVRTAARHMAVLAAAATRKRE